MGASGCPFHVECHFHNDPMKTPGDELLGQLYCNTRYETCEIAKRMLAGQNVPSGACPDGHVKG